MSTAAGDPKDPPKPAAEAKDHPKPEEKKAPADLEKAIHTSMDQSAEALAIARRLEAKEGGEPPPKEDKPKRRGGWDRFKAGFAHENGTKPEDC